MLPRRVVDRLAGRDELLRLRVGQLARIGQLRGDLPVLVELLDRRFVGDRDRDHVAPFFGLADLQHRHAVRRLVERLEVADDVLVVRQLARLARDVAEELQRRRHLVRRRHVIDQLGQDARIGGRRLDLGGVVGVELLRGCVLPAACALGCAEPGPARPVASIKTQANRNRMNTNEVWSIVLSYNPTHAVACPPKRRRREGGSNAEESITGSRGLLAPERECSTVDDSFGA